MRSAKLTAIPLMLKRNQRNRAQHRRRRRRTFGLHYQRRKNENPAPNRKDRCFSPQQQMGLAISMGSIYLTNDC